MSDTNLREILKEEMRKAVVARLRDLHENLDIFSDYWTEKQLRQLMAALGIGIPVSIETADTE